MWTTGFVLGLTGCLVTPPLGPSVDPATNDSATDDLSATIVLTEYVPGSSCKLVLDEDHLYWIELGLAGKPVRAALDHGGLLASPVLGSFGMVPICESAEATLRRVAKLGGAPKVVAKFDDWAWRFSADARDFYWLSLCSASVGRLPRAGGEPTTIDAGFAVMDYLPTSGGRVYVVEAGDRLGAIHLVDPSDHPATIEALTEPGRQTTLIGADARELYFASKSDAWRVYGRAHQTGEIREFAGSGVRPIDSGVRGEQLVLYTRALVVTYDLRSGERLLEHTLAEYEDRGELWLSDEHATWANGVDGTLSRLAFASREVEHASVGGEPCGVAADGSHLYWLDREDGRILQRAHEAVEWFP